MTQEHMQSYVKHKLYEDFQNCSIENVIEEINYYYNTQEKIDKFIKELNDNDDK